jgi:hypothetical protein
MSQVRTIISFAQKTCLSELTGIGGKIMFRLNSLGSVRPIFLQNRQSLHDLLHLRLERCGPDLHDILPVCRVVQDIVRQSLGRRVGRMELISDIAIMKLTYPELIERVEESRDKGSDLGIWTTERLEVELGEFVCPCRESPVKSGNQRSDILYSLRHCMSAMPIIQTYNQRRIHWQSRRPIQSESRS